MILALEKWSLEGRVAVVTGGASGIGAACIEALRERGAVAVSWDVSPHADVILDVSSEEAIKQALEHTIATHGTPSLLIVGAAVRGQATPITHISAESWDAAYAVNVRGAVLTMKAIANAMIDADMDGSIVTIASVNGVLTDSHLSLYSSTKAALAHVSKIAAVELGACGIRVNCVGPGPTSTPMTQHLADNPQWVADTTSMTPLGRIAHPADVAAAIVNIMDSPWITGQFILADGGASLMSARGGMRATLLGAETSTNH